MPSYDATPAQAIDSGRRLFLITGTAQDREARVFRETRIGLRKLAQQELRTLGGLKGTRMKATGTETEGVRVGQRRH